ncbi:hypothetical protein [Gryllotalpicola koreensis]|uniref:hypothetical protein n=1 Tax=Gryllotalpicola koreensis TaxID=993086 RepID=UPI0031CF61C8
MGSEGLLAAVELVPGPPPEAARPRIALAHGQDAAGWWIGLDAGGRCAVGVMTEAGPVSLPVGARLMQGEAVRVVARIPGRSGERLQVELWHGSERVTASAVLGATVVAAAGPVVWGGRAGAAHARLPFLGRVAELLLVGDARVPLEDAVEHPAIVACVTGSIDSSVDGG